MLVKDKYWKLIHLGNIIHTADTNITDSVVRNKVYNLLELGTLLGLVGVELVETVQPCELHNLLRCEEGTNEVWLRAPERSVSVVDILHRRCAVEAILLSCKVVEEREGRQPASGTVFDAHV